MIEATYPDKKIAVEILTQSFDSNKSVEYVIKGGPKRQSQIKNPIDPEQSPRKRLIAFIQMGCWQRL